MKLIRHLFISLPMLIGLAIHGSAKTPGKAVATASKVAEQAPVFKPPVIREQERPADVPFVPTPQSVVEAMLEMAKVNKNDVLYDLGCGDGRIPITAAQKYGTRGFGIDIDPDRIVEATANAATAQVTDKVQFKQQDLFKTDLKEASVVMLYLLPDINLKLRPKLFSELKPGTRVVSHSFTMGEWLPEKEQQINGHRIYMWTIPREVPARLLD